VHRMLEEEYREANRIGRRSDMFLVENRDMVWF
jgi:hypothetical protein